MRLGDKILGTWKLVSCIFKDNAGNVTDFFGKNPVGVLMYDASGYMSAQFMRSDRANFQSDSFSDGTVEEIMGAFKTYQAYYGTFEEIEPGVMIHSVEGCIFPNWSNGKETRYAKLEGNQLILSTQPILVNGVEVIFDAVWVKAV